MAKGSLFSGKKQKKLRISSKMEGGAEKLLEYADAHPSERELAQAKIKAELKRWGVDRRPPTVEEIQQRYNYTAEYAGKFLKKLAKARRPLVKTSAVQVLKSDEQVLTTRALEPMEQRAVRVGGVGSSLVQLKAILADIRLRYGDEVRNIGEQTSAKEGFVYLVTHPCYSGWVKAGMTIDFEFRLATYNTSDPLSRFEYVEIAWTPDRRDAERQLLTALQRIAAETRGEWFRMSLRDAMTTFGLFKRMRCVIARDTTA